MNSSNSFAFLIEKYFLSYMMTQKKVSPCTISSYRDSFKLYIRYISSEFGVDPAKIEFEHFSLDYLISFGNHLEIDRNCCASTINQRMAAIKSFLSYAIIEAPEYSNTIRKSLTLPCRKADEKVMSFLSKQEYETMLEICNSDDFVSTRDKLMLMIMYNTGCRVSELINIQVSDINLANDNSTSSILFYGKGRKERITPIWSSTSSYIQKYIENNSLKQTDRLFKNIRKGVLTRSGVGQRITAIKNKAIINCPSLKEKIVTPHTFRHSAAMNLLQAGVDITTIAIWLGHESIETTHKYMVADIELKRRAMEKMEEPDVGYYNYKPSKSILDFLNKL